MKKLLPILIFTAVSYWLTAQTFQPTWESLDKRPVPQWFRDSKFGIFIHWGVYSVPGWCTKGSYAEWYQYGLNTGDTSRIAFHKKKFGDLSYYQLADQFKAELYNPDEWAQLFEKSGAKYIVLTSKHHDGFCLWPNKDANRDWGFPWNAADIGPKRDLLGDLFKAVRKTSVHAGMYYSLYEWFNPLWKADKNKYATEHAWPQMKELITTYQPEVFWTDGDWEADENVWKSKEFMAWMYNESPVKNSIVTYDRWGSGIRFKHGSIYTPEYQPDLDFEDHYWEESRGMGYSYGYNREEDAWDYNSTQSLVLHLIDKVSRGGNFLLDIGPDEHGKIPPIMQERLLQIGDWLKINGEAIYGTTRWKTTAQWSEGKMGYKPKKGEDFMLKMTIDPQTGYAIKEAFFTYNEKTNSLYAILPKYPGGKRQVTLKDMDIAAGTNITLLGTGDHLSFTQKNAATGNGKDVIIQLPEYDPNKMKAPYAYVMKIAGYGKFAHKPVMKIRYETPLQPVVGFDSLPGTAIYYTTDGSEPVVSSTLYTKPFRVDKTSMVKARAFLPGALPGAVAAQQVIRYQWMPAVKTANPAAGITYHYYEPSGVINLSAVETSLPVKTGVVNTISLTEKQRRERFAFAFNGYIKIPKDGVYVFYTNSDDGSKLFIDDVETVDNDGEHGGVEQSGRAALKKGFHRLRVVYFDSGGGNDLKVMIQAEGESKKEIPAAMLYHAQ